MRKILFALVLLSASAPNIGVAGEWRFFAPYGSDGNVVLLSEDASAARGCEGMREASEQKYALEKWIYIRELCYEVDKRGMVRLKDPARMRFFNTFTISSSAFTKILNKKERDEVEQSRRAEETRRAINELSRQWNAEQQQRQQVQQQWRGPIICNHLGDISICD